MPHCKITIIDEVNCKIADLDLDTRKRLVTKFKFELPYARHMPAFKLGRWDGKVPYFNLGGTTYVNLLPEIIEWLAERNWSFELEDKRPQYDFQFQQVDEESFSHIVWPKGHVAEGKPIMLRDYQVEIINTFLENPMGIQEVATGAGKTIMTAALSSRVEPYGRSVVIVPNIDLVKQTEADYRNMGLDVGVFFGDRKEYGKTHTICTWQSLNNIGKKEKDELVRVVSMETFFDGVVAIIVDETHQAKAEVLKSLLTDTLAHIPIRWGLTGTIPKEQFEQVALKVSLGDVLNQLSASELQAKGVLSNCHVNIVQTAEHSAFTNYQSELAYLTTDPDRLDYLAGLIKTINDSGNTLVLVDRISAGEGLVERLGGSAVFVSGTMDSDDRKVQYDEVANVDDKIIVATYGVAAVGINIPRIFNLVLIEPGKSFVRVIQSIGRGIRKAEDKDFVQIWDITGDCKFAKRHLTKRKQFYREANYPFTQQKVSYK
jgi:superfamily II DNA or RNA helicase